MSDLEEELKRFEAELAAIAGTDEQDIQQQQQQEQEQQNVSSIINPATNKTIIAAPRILAAPRSIIANNIQFKSNTSLISKGLIVSAQPSAVNEPTKTVSLNAQSVDIDVVSATISPHVTPIIQHEPSSPPRPHKKQRVADPTIRSAAGTVWKDESLSEWPANDFRIFVGDLGIEVNDAMLSKLFSHYSSFAMARVVRDKKTNSSRGYGFVSLTDHEEGVTALKEMQGKYCGNRPIKLKRSDWQKRSAPAPVRSRFKPRH